MSDQELPEFRKHGFDRKFVALQLHDYNPAPKHIDQFVKFLEWASCGSLETLKILDLGCGRGEFVGALRGRGARAYGIEIDPRFVESGAILGRLHSDEFPILSVVDSNGKSIFPDGYFDLVISDQVLEHVADLEAVTRETARLLRRGGLTCHQFPASHRFVEPHYKLPMVHWLPKNGVRRTALKALLAARFSKQFFPEYSLEERTTIIFKYSVEQTFYRSIRSLSQAFTAAGLIPRFRPLMHLFVESRLNQKLPSYLPIAELVSFLRTVMFCATKK